jgi:hypothetical protein
VYLDSLAEYVFSGRGVCSEENKFWTFFAGRGSCEADAGSIAQYHIQERRVDTQSAVVVDESRLAKLVQE